MWPFKKKQAENVNLTLVKRVDVLEEQLNILTKQYKRDILDIYTDIDAIRNKVLRKIQFKKQEIEENTENPESWAGIPLTK